jgi:N-acetylmuramoyl-L-alanine amidase
MTSPTRLHTAIYFFLMIILFSNPVVARVVPENIDSKLNYQGNEVALGSPLVVLDNVIYAPVNDLAAAFRFKAVPLAISSATKITRESDNASITLQPYSKTIRFNEEMIQWSSHPLLVKGVLYAPIKEFCESFGYGFQSSDGQLTITDTIKESTAPVITAKARPVAETSITVDRAVSRDEVVVVEHAPEKPREMIKPVVVPPVIPEVAHGMILATTGRYAAVSVNSCWLPDLTAYQGLVTFDVRGRILTHIGEDVRQGVLYVPAQRVLGPFDYAVHYATPARHISITRTNGSHLESLEIDEGALHGTYNGRPITLERPLVLEKGRIYMPLIEILKILRIGCRWGDLRSRIIYIEPLIDEIYVRWENGRSSIVIAGSEPIEVKNSLELVDPYRIVMDIPHSIVNLPVNTLPLTGTDVQKIRIAQFKDDVTRIVLELDRPRTYGLGADSSGKEILVDFVTWINRIYTIEEKDKITICVESTGPVSFNYKILQDPDRLVINIPNSSLRTGNYLAVGKKGIERVRASQFSWSPLMTRVVVDLTTSRPCTVKQELNKLLVRFPTNGSYVQPAASPPVMGDDAVTMVSPPQGGVAGAVLPAAVKVTSSIVVPRTQYVSTGLRGKKIVIDPGHGGTDPGAISRSGSKEKEINLAIAKALQKLLLADGALPLLVIEDDSFMGMEDRARFAERNKADAVISIHLNSFIKPSIRGMESYWYKDNDLKLTKAVHEEILRTCNLPDKGVKQSQMYILNHTTMPGVLIEPIYLSNPEDEALIRSEQFRYNIALGIRNGLRRYFTK